MSETRFDDLPEVLVTAKKQPHFKDLALEYLATNQPIVGLNPVQAQIKSWVY